MHVSSKASSSIRTLSCRRTLPSPDHERWSIVRSFFTQPARPPPSDGSLLSSPACTTRGARFSTYTPRSRLSGRSDHTGDRLPTPSRSTSCRSDESLFRSSSMGARFPAGLSTSSPAPSLLHRTMSNISSSHHPQPHPKPSCSTCSSSSSSPDPPPPPVESSASALEPPPPYDPAHPDTPPPVTIIDHASPPPHPHTIRASLLSTYPRSLARLAALLPSTPYALDPHHRPSKADLLKLTDSAWQRARIRWKWLTIRGFRRFNVDDWGAVVSWVLVGNIGWLVLGTGSFFGMVLLTANVFSLEDHIAKLLSDYFTSGSGITVIFESALVPNLFHSTITLNNVYISRRPQRSASPVGGASFKYGPEDHRDHHPADGEQGQEEEDDGNYTQFDLNVDRIEVELSFVNWLNGEGIVKAAVVSGVRGVIDRRSVHWDSANPWIPREWRHPSTPGDGSFNLSKLIVEDMLCTVYQPGGFRPFNISVFKAELGKFRKKWAFYDFLNAEGITGQYDGCLVSLHKPQRIGKTVGEDLKDGSGDRMTRLRVDGLPIDHMQGATSTGPLAWITSGKLDGVIDVSFPRHPDDEVNFNSVLSEIIDNVSELASRDAKASRESINPGQRLLAKAPLTAPAAPKDEKTGRDVVVDVDLRFRDLKAVVPYMPDELSYVNAALIRPIVAFINANRTLLPIQCRVVCDLNEFDGSWTPWEAGLLDATSDQVYSALAHHVTSHEANNQRLKAVGVWSLQMAAELAVGAVRNVLLQRKVLGLGDWGVGLTI